MFRAGNIKNCIEQWKCITDDKHVLETVAGCHIDFSEIPYQSTHTKPINFSKEENEIVEKEIQTMIEKGVIQESRHETGEFISNIFIRPKKDGRFRIILNLKPFNQYVEAEHFKMDSIITCLNLMNNNCCMASIDLRDAYYSVPMAESQRKYLKFEWNNKLYEYTCLPMGLACAPRKFVKLMKPVFAFLHNEGHVSSGYLDDIFIQGDSYDICMNNIQETVNLLTKLGFFVHYDKSIMTPCQEIEHLGFILNSKEMTVRISGEKHVKLVNKIDYLLNSETFTIRNVASAVGSMISYLPGVQFGALFYRQIELEKIKALKENKGNFEGTMTLSQAAIEQLIWWKEQAMLYPAHIETKESKYTLCTDASMSGWGATMANKKCGGRWSEEEKSKHINELELLAVEFGLRSLCSEIRGEHIKIKSDNMTTVAYIRNMGGCKSPKCNFIARRIWLWALNRDIWLTITHIEGRLNKDPDELSRVFDDKTEWMLNPILFNKIKGMFKMDIDLFASRLNKQLDNYVTWQPDPHAYVVDAFTINWTVFNGYIFSPFSMIPRVLAKLETERAQAVVIAPYWPAQGWFSKLTRMLTQPPLLLPRGKKQLILPFNREAVHPLWRKLHLLVCPLSGDASKSLDFRKNHRKLFYTPGGQGHINSITHIWGNGPTFAVDGVRIPIVPL